MKENHRKLIIASISETDSWGAGLSALKLHQAFLAAGQESKLYVNRKFSSCEGVIEIPGGQDDPMSAFEIGQYRSEISDIPMTTGLSSKCNRFLEEVWANADVVLLRWASVTVSDFQIGRWSNRKKPLVWCLSDLAPITGGCHYSKGCNNFTNTCSPCPQSDSDFPYLPSTVLHRRKKLWDNITYVSPSRWLAALCRKSVVAKNHQVEVIRTGVELDIFSPYEKPTVRDEMGLELNKRVIMYGAASVKDSRKGAHFLPQLIDQLVAKYFSADEIVLLVTGRDTDSLSGLPVEVVKLGHVSDRAELAKAYSASDVTLLPYVEDNLPNQCLESIACGTPVAAFEVGGMPDVVIPGVTGNLAVPFDVQSLTKSVVQILTSNTGSYKCREWAQKNLDIGDQVQKYLALFNNLCEKS